METQKVDFVHTTSGSLRCSRELRLPHVTVKTNRQQAALEIYVVPLKHENTYAMYVREAHGTQARWETETARAALSGGL